MWDCCQKIFIKTQESKYLPSNCSWSCSCLGRCSRYRAALIMDLILRNAYSFFFTHANTVSLLPLLIAHESWTWSQKSTSFVKHKRTPVFFLFFFLSHEAWIKSSPTVQRLLALCSCSLTAENISPLTMPYLEETLHRELFRSCRTGIFASVLWKIGGLFSWSNPDKHIAVRCCLVVVCLPVFVSQFYCNDVFPTCWHLVIFSFPVLVPPPWNVQWAFDWS